LIQEITMRTDKTTLESIVFFKYFHHLPVHRQEGRVIYSLDEVLLLSLTRGVGGSGDFPGYCPVWLKEA
jgi:hypothetical protein